MSTRPSDDHAEQTETYGDVAYRRLCEGAVERWNDELRDVGRARNSPTISIATQARYYFLDVFCPGCRQTKQLDLRTVDRHERTRVEALIPSLSCRGCRPHAPFAELRGLSKENRASPNAAVPTSKTGS